MESIIQAIYLHMVHMEQNPQSRSIAMQSFRRTGIKDGGLVTILIPFADCVSVSEVGRSIWMPSATFMRNWLTLTQVSDHRRVSSDGARTGFANHLLPEDSNHLLNVNSFQALAGAIVLTLSALPGRLYTAPYRDSAETLVQVVQTDARSSLVSPQDTRSTERRTGSSVELNARRGTRIARSASHEEASR